MNLMTIICYLGLKAFKMDEVNARGQINSIEYKVKIQKDGHGELLYRFK